MERSRIKELTATVLLMVGWSLMVCAGPLSGAESKPRYGGTLRLADMTDGVSIGYPPKLLRVFSNRQVAPAVETLFRTDKTGRPVPWLATGFKEDSKAKAITVTLRKGVKFHDGTDFNAEAAKWNLDQCVAAHQSGTERIKSVDAIDPYIIRINLSEWDSTVTSNFAMSLGMMISPSAYAKNGEEWCATHPVGTGPFQFVSWEKDVRTVYKKFPDYWQKGKPYLDAIEWTPIYDTLPRLLSLKKGEIDLAISLEPKDVGTLEKEGFVVVRRKVGAGIMSLVPDSANPSSPWANLKVRQAAQYALDTETLVKTIYHGQSEAVNQEIYKGHWGYNPSVVGYPYNPARARQLLAEAGYPGGFKTKLFYRTTPLEDQLFVAIQGYLKAVGIEAELEAMQKALFDQKAWKGGGWEGLIMGGYSANPDIAAQLATMFSGGTTFYTKMAVPDDYAKAIQRAISAPDFKTKQKRVQEAMKLMVDKYCLHLTIWCPVDFAAARPQLHNHGFLETPNTGWWTPEDAWIER